MWETILNTAVSSAAQAAVTTMASQGGGTSGGGGFNAYQNAMSNSAANSLIPATARPKQKQASTPAPTVTAQRQSSHPLAAWSNAFRGED